MSGGVEQAGSGESARKKEKQKNCDQPIRRQQWSVHDGMHRQQHYITFAEIYARFTVY